jgi:hypothetical protein
MVHENESSCLQRNLLVCYLKGLPHEMDLAFDDMYG